MQQNAKGVGILLRWPVLISFPDKKNSREKKVKGQYSVKSITAISMSWDLGAGLGSIARELLQFGPNRVIFLAHGRSPVE